MEILCFSTTVTTFFGTTVIIGLSAMCSGDTDDESKWSSAQTRLCRSTCCRHSASDLLICVHAPTCQEATSIHVDLDRNNHKTVLCALVHSPRSRSAKSMQIDILPMCMRPACTAQCMQGAALECGRHMLNAYDIVISHGLKTIYRYLHVLGMLWKCWNLCVIFAGESIGLGYFYQAPVTGITGRAGLFINVSLFCIIALSIAVFPVHVFECQFHDGSYRYACLYLCMSTRLSACWELQLAPAPSALEFCVLMMFNVLLHTSFFASARRHDFWNTETPVDAGR